MQRPVTRSLTAENERCVQICRNPFAEWLTPTAAVSLLGVAAAMAAATLLAKQSEEVYQARRENMVREQIESRGIKDKAVLAAFRKVPRHRFVPDGVAASGVHRRAAADRRKANHIAARDRRLDDRADPAG